MRRGRVKRSRGLTLPTPKWHNHRDELSHFETAEFFDRPAGYAV